MAHYPEPTYPSIVRFTRVSKEGIGAVKARTGMEARLGTASALKRCHTIKTLEIDGNRNYCLRRISVSQPMVTWGRRRYHYCASQRAARSALDRYVCPIGHRETLCSVKSDDKNPILQRIIHDRIVNAKNLENSSRGIKNKP